MTAHPCHLGILEITNGLTIVSPLANKACVVGHTYGLLFACNGEGGLTVVVVRSYQQIQGTVVLISGKLQGLPLTGQAIGSIFLAKGEGDIAHGDTFVGQQFGCIAVTTLEVARGAELVEAETVAVEIECHRLGIDSGRLLTCQLNLIGLDAVRLDIYQQLGAIGLGIGQGAFCTIGLNSLHNASREADARLLVTLTAHLIHTNDILITHLGTLQGAYHHILII